MLPMLLAALAAAAVVLWPCPAAALVQPLVVQGIDTSAYPQVTARVLLPSSMIGAAAGAPEFSVSENGRTVADVAAEALPGNRAPVAVVLAIDTSGSMKGAPLAAAKRAAAEFVGIMAPDDRIAVMSFSTRPKLVAGFTTDRARLRRAIDSLSSGGETALHDSVIAAVALAATSSSGSRSVVLLSDGGDTQSVATFPTAMQAVRSAAVPIFALGLDSPEADAGTLQRLAEQSHGRALAVKGVAALGAVYANVAREIQTQYSVSFTSLRPNTSDLEFVITASSGDGKAAATVAVPNPGLVVSRAAPAALVTRVPVVAGAAGILLAAGLVFLAVSLFVYWGAVLLVRERTTIDQLRYYESGAPIAEGPKPVPGGLRARMMSAVGYVAGKRGLTAAIQASLERAGLPLRPVEFIFVHLSIVVMVGLATQVIGGTLWVSVVLIALAAAAPLVVLDFLATKRKAAFQAQLPDVLGLIAGSLRAGYGLLQAVELVVQEVRQPASAEFKRVQIEARLGLPVEEALSKMAERMDSDDFRWTVGAVNIQREVGGNLAEVLDIVAGTIRERDALRRQISVLTSEGRISEAVLLVLPFVVGLGLFLVNPHYLGLLFATPLGTIFVVIGVVLLIIGALWVRAVSTIEV